MLIPSWKFRVSQVTPPAGLPVSASAVRDHLRMVSAADDSVIDAWIATAVDAVESWTGRKLLTRRVRAFVDLGPEARSTLTDLAFCTDPVIGAYLPGCPLVAAEPLVVTLYTDDAEVVQPADTIHTFVTADAPGILLRQGCTWATTKTRPADSLSVEYSVGYGPTADDVPAGLIQAVVLIASAFYAGCTAPMTDPGIISLMAPFRIVRL